MQVVTLMSVPPQKFAYSDIMFILSFMKIWEVFQKLLGEIDTPTND